MRRILSFALGGIAPLATAAVLCTQLILLNSHADHVGSSGRAASITSIALESAVMLLLCWLHATILVPALKPQSHRWLGIIFGLGVMLSMIAASASIAGLVYFSVPTHDTQKRMIIGSSVAVGLSVSGQLGFMGVHFASAEKDILGTTGSLDEEAGQPSSRVNFKSIRYSETLPSVSQSQCISEEMEHRGRFNSIGGKSAAETVLSSMTSVSHALRVSTSRTKILPSREKGRPESSDSSPNRSSGDDTFDSWDTSAVDLHNRQAVLEMSPVQARIRGLETIPASPMVSRSPSPESQSDIIEPRRLRNRSYSSLSLRCGLQTPTTPVSGSESHIHPLFRTDSPDPHPLATPGTIVVAAPDAVRAVVHRASTRSLHRMRSNSLLMAPSPLSKQDSFEDRIWLKTQRSELDIITGSEPEKSNAQTETQTETQREMTPPVPEWLLSGRAETQ